MPPKANRGRSSLSAQQTTSFFLVSGFGSGAYSAKLFAGTKHRCSGFSPPRQCGDVVLRMFVTGKPPARGGGGIPHQHHNQLALAALIVANHRGRVVGKHARHRREVADVPVDDAVAAYRWKLHSENEASARLVRLIPEV